MATVVWAPLVAAVLCLCSVVGGDLGGVGAGQACEESCGASFSPHTNPTAEENSACRRGCRFYSIISLFKDDSSASTTVKTSCQNACEEAYNSTSSQGTACTFGCESEATADHSKAAEGGDGGGEGEEGKTGLHLLSPLLQVRSVYFSIVGAVRVIHSSLVTYFLSDDNSIISVESEPRVIMEVMVSPPPPAHPHSPSEPHQPPAEPRQGLAVGGGMTSVQRVEKFFLPKSEAAMIGVLALSFIATLLLYYLCVAYAPRKSKVYGEGLSIQADALPLPVKLVRPEDLTRLSLTEEDDEEQAPPLPSKIALPATTI